jgi:hypothetical protein
MKKPPLGIEPEYIWKGRRVFDLEDAIQRRIGKNFEIPKEWIIERNKLIKELKQC